MHLSLLPRTTVMSKNRKKITRYGKPGDPAIVLDTGKSRAVKLAHELDWEGGRPRLVSEVN